MKEVGHWTEAYLQALQHTGSKTLAAKVAGVNRSTVYDHSKVVPSFREREVEALDRTYVDACRQKVGQKQNRKFKLYKARVESDCKGCGDTIHPGTLRYNSRNSRAEYNFCEVCVAAYEKFIAKRNAWLEKRGYYGCQVQSNGSEIRE